MPLCVYTPAYWRDKHSIRSSSYSLLLLSRWWWNFSFFFFFYVHISQENLKVCNFKCVYTFPSLHLCHSILLLYSLIRCNLCTLRKKVLQMYFPFFAALPFVKLIFVKIEKFVIINILSTCRVYWRNCVKVNFCKKISQMDLQLSSYPT